MTLLATFIQKHPFWTLVLSRALIFQGSKIISFLQLFDFQRVLIQLSKHNCKVYYIKIPNIDMYNLCMNRVLNFI